MDTKKISTVVAIIIGISMVVLGFVYKGKFNFIIGSLGIALIGLSIELFLENKKDTITENGQSRNKIDIHDERTIFVNAKSGEAMNLIMSFFTIVALIVAKLLNVSSLGITIIASLIMIRLIVNPIVHRYYEKRV